jgi:hypothetical protein
MWSNLSTPDCRALRARNDSFFVNPRLPRFARNDNTRLPRFARNDNTMARNDNDTPCHCATFPLVIARSEATKQSHSFPSLRTNVKQSKTQIAALRSQ